MIEQWALVCGDFLREYRIRDDELAAMGTGEFVFRLRGLSDRSRFRRALGDEGPAELSEAQAARALGKR